MSVEDWLRTDAVLTWAVILASIALVACGGYAAGPRNEGEAEAYAAADAGPRPRECQTITYDLRTGYASSWGACPPEDKE